ncbi:MAG: YitT family protein [Bacteroidetes bacterium]|nr:YitT family protein [Bacteroidota bacterium]
MKPDVTQIKESTIILKNNVKSVFLILLGITSATIGLKGFLLPNGFLDGGVTGISLLTNQITGVNISLLIVLINIPFILIGYKQVSLTFAIKTLLAIIGLAIAISLVEINVDIDKSTDTLLISVFGGFFLGTGIGLCIRGGAVIDGTEVLAIALSKKSSLSVGDVISIINVVIFSASAYLVGMKIALYSMLTYFVASKAVDFVTNGIEEYIGITIVSEKADEMKQVIIKNLGRGVTVYKGESGFGSTGIRESEDRKILFCVVTRLETHKILVEIEKVDSKAFVIQHSINETRGGMIKKRPLH